MTAEQKPLYGTQEDNIELQHVFHHLKIDPLEWAQWYIHTAAQRQLPSTILAANLPEVIRIIEANKGQHPSVFGSVARGADTVSSDINLSVDARECSMLDLGRMRTELQQLLGVPVSIIPSDAMSSLIEKANHTQGIPLSQFHK